ncbi:methyltransferase [Streptomyces sp. NPDC007901]|uniref:methyltransferase n=1 Tax=Streptomyces sp. NPDC007901 TaxID=3364785 RepID=UPI0036E63F11
MPTPDDHGGYGERLLGQSRPGEADRLAALADACDPATVAVLDALPLAPDSRCLDVGAGLGTIARRLLARCPRGTVTAADLDTRFLDGTADPRLDVRQLDVRTADLPAALRGPRVHRPRAGPGRRLGPGPAFLTHVQPGT